MSDSIRENNNGLDNIHKYSDSVKTYDRLVIKNEIYTFLIGKGYDAMQTRLLMQEKIDDYENELIGYGVFLDDGIKDINISENGLLTFTSKDDDKYTFDLLESEKKAKETLRKKLENLDNIIASIDYVFENNVVYYSGSLKDTKGIKRKSYKMLKTEFDMEVDIRGQNYDAIVGGDTLVTKKDNRTKLDTDEFGTELNGKTIKELQAMARENWHNIVKLRKETKITDNGLNEELIVLEEKYLEFIMGIGEKYEGGAKAFDKTQLEVLYLFMDIMNSKKDMEEVYGYMKKINLMIKNNITKSPVVDELNLEFVKKMNRLAWEKLQSNNPSYEDIVYFIKLITGREGGIHTEMEDADLANEIMTNAMGRDSGILEKMYNEGISKITDKEFLPKKQLMQHYGRGGGIGTIEVLDFDKDAGKEKPSEVVNDFISEYNKINFTMNGMPCEKTKGDVVLEKAGMKGFKELGEKDYYELSLSEKSTISMLYRITKKLKQQKSKNMELEIFGGVINTAAVETQEEINDAIRRSFEGGLLDFRGINGAYLSKYKDENGNPLFSKVELELVDLYTDINGQGIFNLSDGSTNAIGGFVKYGVPILIGAALFSAVAVAVLPEAIASSPVLFGGIVGGAASAISWTNDTRGFDSKEERFAYYASDIIVGTTTGMAGGRLAKYYIDRPGKGFMKKIVGNPKGSVRNTALFGSDLAFLGFGPEIARQIAITKIYSPSNLYEDNPELDEELFGRE